MDRKTFLKKTAGILLITAPVYALLSCSTSSEPIPVNDPIDLGDCSQNGASASSISGNHGHSLTVSSADVNAGVEKTYGIQGSAPHSHSVTLTPSDFNNLLTSSSILVNSTQSDGHDHGVTITCA